MEKNKKHFRGIHQAHPSSLEERLAYLEYLRMSDCPGSEALALETKIQEAVKNGRGLRWLHCSHPHTSSSSMWTFHCRKPAFYSPSLPLYN